MRATYSRFRDSFPPAWRRPILAETGLLALICVLDMASTLVLVQLGLAVEANPILAWTLEGSGWVFLVVKTLSFLVPLVIIEYLRTHTPRFIPLALRAGVVGYLAVYVIGSLRIHGMI